MDFIEEDHQKLIKVTQESLKEEGLPAAREDLIPPEQLDPLQGAAEMVESAVSLGGRVGKNVIADVTSQKHLNYTVDDNDPNKIAKDRQALMKRAA